MSKKYDFDYIIIGSGPAGSAAALTLASAKKRVALVEKRFFGGSNLNTRDVPFATALDFAHTFHRTLTFPELKNQDIFFNLPSIPAHELKAVIESGGNNRKIFESAGITCFKGIARFLNSNTIIIGDKKITAKSFILATGTKPKTPNIAGVETVRHLTPETAIKLSRMPKVVAIIGGGPSGTQLAEYYAELGIKVILLEASDHLLPREDQEIGETLSNYFTQKLGVNVLTNSTVLALEQDSFSKCIIFQNPDGEKMVRVDLIVLATGSEPNLDFDPNTIKLKCSPTGIIVNRLFETSVKNIYAVGSCLGFASSTDSATQEGTSLASNLAYKTKSPLNYQGLVRTIKTFPEISIVGQTENDLIRRGHKYHKILIPLSDIPASKIYDIEHGFIKLLSNRSKHLLGATIVAPHAELLISELALALRHNLSLLEIASTPHSINSYNYFVRIAAKKLLDSRPKSKKSSAKAKAKARAKAQTKVKAKPTTKSRTKAKAKAKIKAKTKAKSKK